MSLRIHAHSHPSHPQNAKRHAFVFLLVALCGAGTLHAQPSSTAIPAPAPYDDNLNLQQLPQIQQRRPAIGAPSQADASQRQQLPQVTDEDLKSNRQLAERVINQAMFAEDWETLQHLMSFYPQMDGADPILVDYVLGAMARHQGRHSEAIRRYRRIVDAHPELSYVRLDLAAMLFENKAYRDAGEELATVQRDMRLAPVARASAVTYQQAVDQQQRWHGSYALGYTWTSNVNSATDNRYFYMPAGMVDDILLLWEMEKADEDMRHSGHGPTWAARANRDVNLSGNHFLSLSGGADGTSYHNYSNFNEIEGNIQLGYKYQDLNAWFGVTPTASKLWLGGDGYSSTHGVSVDYGRWLGNSWQASAAFTWLKRNYDESRYADYEGDIRSWSFNLVHVFSPDFIAFAGAGQQDESTTGAEESSMRRSVHIGAINNFGAGISTRTSFRFTRRSFDAPQSLFLWQNRRDREYQANASIWKRDWSILGMTPKLNFNYERVKSTLYAYGRSEKEVTLMFEKTF